jgi:hypothetical protein
MARRIQGYVVIALKVDMVIEDDPEEERTVRTLAITAIGEALEASKVGSVMKPPANSEGQWSWELQDVRRYHPPKAPRGAVAAAANKTVILVDTDP